MSVADKTSLEDISKMCNSATLLINEWLPMMSRSSENEDRPSMETPQKTTVFPLQSALHQSCSQLKTNGINLVLSRLLWLWCYKDTFTLPLVFATETNYLWTKMK